MLVFGMTHLFRGLRRGMVAEVLVGAAVVAVALLRRDRSRELLYQAKLKPGQSLRIERPGLGAESG